MNLRSATSIIVAEGWNLPNPSRLILEKVEKKRYPGMSFEIISEHRRAKAGAGYNITNALCTPDGASYPTISIKEKAWSLITYKTPEGEILCYRYYRLLVGPTKKSRAEAEKLHLSLLLADGGLASFVCDLDNDGVIESMIDVPYSDKEEERLLVSILKLKLGIAEGLKVHQHD